MSEETLTEAESEAGAAPRNLPNPHLLAYDFFKHMTSLSVLTLGGVLTLSGSIFQNVEDPTRLYFSLGLIIAGGVFAFAGQIEMVEWAHRGTGRPRTAARWGRSLVAMCYGGGVGAFLGTVHGSLT